jgi:hypothetical protein
MRLNTDPTAPAAPQGKPCIRDMHELVTQHLPEQLVKLVPLDQLDRRCDEIDADHPHLQEETQLVRTLEAKRRARYRGPRLAGSHTPALPTTLQVYSRA